MAIIFLTGLSGVGTTSTLDLLKKQGYNTVDTDYGYTKLYDDGNYKETIWDEEKITQLIYKHKDNHLFLSGCYSNQGKFYKYFDQVVLLTAELDVMLDRVKKRTTNPYGKSPEERNEIIENHKNVLPLLKKRSDLIIDTTYKSIEEVCAQIKNL